MPFDILSIININDSIIDHTLKIIPGSLVNDFSKECFNIILDDIQSNKNYYNQKYIGGESNEEISLLSVESINFPSLLTPFNKCFCIINPSD